METFTQPKITGYRQLTEQEAQLMNDIKAVGRAIEQQIEAISAHLSRQFVAANDDNDHAELLRLDKAAPHDWIERGQHHLQIGLMELTRAVAQPDSF